MNPQPHSSSLGFGVILLAAGASVRMGRPKLLLPWGRTTVLEHLFGIWRELGAEQFAIVCAANHAPLHAELDRLRFPVGHRIINPAPERGMFSSIQCAAAWTTRTRAPSHWIVSLGDQPHVKLRSLGTLLEFARTHPDKICQPSRHGRGRHPVLLPRGFFGELATTNAENLKEFLHEHSSELARIEINDTGLDTDMDTPAEYESALAFAGLSKV